MKKLLFSILFSILFLFPFSQGVIKIIGEQNVNDGPTSFIQKENNFIVGGYAGDVAYLKEIDENGNILWIKKVDFTEQIDYISDLVYRNGSLFGCGYGRQSGTGNFEEFFFKFDPVNQKLEWVKRSNLKLKPNNISMLPDGKILIAGDEYSGGKFGIFLMTLDPSKGKDIDFKTYYFSGNESASDIIIRNNTIYSAGRYGLKNKVHKYRGAISAFSINDLEHQWTKYYLNKKNSYSRAYLSSIKFDNENIIAAFFTNNFGILGEYTVSLAKMNLDGEIEWGFEFLPLGFDNVTVRDLAVVEDGYLIYGFTKSPSRELFLIKTDKEGILQWSKVYGDYFDDDIIADQGDFMIVKNDEIYLVAQTKNGVEDNLNNTVFLKMSEDGTVEENCWGTSIDINQKSYLELVEGEIVLSNYDTTFRVSNAVFNEIINEENNNIENFICYPFSAKNDIDTIVENDIDTIYFLENDAFLHKESLQAKIISTPNFGETKLQSDSTISYVPFKSCQLDSFQYEITSKKLIKDTATIYIYTAAFLKDETLLKDTILPKSNRLSLSVNQQFDNYLWSTGSKSNTITIEKPGRYSFTGNIDGCIFKKSFSVKENPYSFDNVATNNLVLLLDVSLSMNTSKRLPVLKKSLYDILGYMRNSDKLSIISYSNNAEIIANGITANSVETIQQKIDSLTSNGQSNLIGGMELGFETIENNYEEKGNNRIILATDGDISNEKRFALERLLAKSLNEKTFFTIFLFNNSTLFINQLQEVVSNYPNSSLVVVDENNIDNALLKELKAIRNF